MPELLPEPEEPEPLEPEPLLPMEPELPEPELPALPEVLGEDVEPVLPDEEPLAPGVLALPPMVDELPVDEPDEPALGLLPELPPIAELLLLPGVAEPLPEPPAPADDSPPRPQAARDMVAAAITARTAPRVMEELFIWKTPWVVREGEKTGSPRCLRPL